MMCYEYMTTRDYHGRVHNYKDIAGGSLPPADIDRFGNEQPHTIVSVRAASTWPIKALIVPDQLIALARFANSLPTTRKGRTHARR